MKKPEQAVTYFNNGFNCAQAVLSVFSNQFNIDKETALKLASGFGGGMGRMAETCGAVTGAFMVLGLKYGNLKAEDKESKEKTYSLIKKFTDRFCAKNRSILCKEILGYDISSTQEHTIAREKGLFSQICPKCVKDSVEILEEMLKD